MRRFTPLFLSLAVLMCTAAAAFACHVGGFVVCDANGVPLSGIRVDVTSTDGTYTRYAVTDEHGRYDIALLCSPTCYRLTVQTPNGETIVSPASGYFDFCADASTNYSVEAPEWHLNSPSCPTTTEPGLCWLTAGGAKFSPITGTDVGDYTKFYNWGGNVYPGCSSTAGDGGSWNNIDALHRLHFHGTDITVLRCGNMPDIPPGSTSPPTGFNFIEFTGTGWLKGIKGNKADYGTVYFWAHCEDRNEPGSTGMRDGAGKDRYFLNVYTNPADPVGSSVMLVDVDHDPATMDPVTITDGNMQLHASSCESALTALINSTPEESMSGGGARVAFLASPYPNPGPGARAIRFGLPTSSAVTLRVFDAAGRMVRTLETGVLPAGEFRSSWDLRDDGGSLVPSGVYFVRLAMGRQVFSRSVTVTP